MGTFRMIVTAAMLTAVLPFKVHAAAGDILGIWLNAEQDASIEITMCGERYCGRIIWLKEPDYPAGAKDGMPGTPKLDHNNPDPMHRKDPIIGLEIVKAFRFVGDDRWEDGTVYDPKNGKTYQGKMTLLSSHRLDLRGFIGISLLGRTTTWTR
jgi:uncharacterized protein (DUF2147 family)